MKVTGKAVLDINESDWASDSGYKLLYFLVTGNPEKPQYLLYFRRTIVGVPFFALIYI